MTNFSPDNNDSSMALKYIQAIQNKTKNNQSLTLTIFKKLFTELPFQIEVIKDALDKQYYELAKETVHKLHGSVCFCDLEDLRKPAYTLENHLLNKNYIGIIKHCCELEKSILNFLRYQSAILSILQ